MKIPHILSLVLILSFSSVVLSSCNDGYDLECWIDMFFGDDESSEEVTTVNENQVTAIANLSEAVTNLTTTLQNKDKVAPSKSEEDTKDKLDQIPYIVASLMNLTRVVENVQSELSGKNPSKHPKSESPNEIKKEDKPSKQRSNNSAEKIENSSGEKTASSESPETPATTPKSTGK